MFEVCKAFIRLKKWDRSFTAYLMEFDRKYEMKSDNFLYFRLTIHLVYIGDYKRRKKKTRDIKRKLTESLNLRDSEIILLFYLQVNILFTAQYPPSS